MISKVGTEHLRQLQSCASAKANATLPAWCSEQAPHQRFVSLHYLLFRANISKYKKKKKIGVKFLGFECAETILEGILPQSFLSLTSRLFFLFLRTEGNPSSVVNYYTEKEQWGFFFSAWNCPYMVIQIQLLYIDRPK